MERKKEMKMMKHKLIAPDSDQILWQKKNWIMFSLCLFPCAHLGCDMAKDMPAHSLFRLTMDCESFLQHTVNLLVQYYCKGHSWCFSKNVHFSRMVIFLFQHQFAVCNICNAQTASKLRKKTLLLFFFYPFATASELVLFTKMYLLCQTVLYVT